MVVAFLTSPDVCSFDGKVKLWSSEGHSVDVLDVSLEAITGIAYVPHTKSYWITGEQTVYASGDSILRQIGNDCWWKESRCCKSLQEQN